MSHSNGTNTAITKITDTPRVVSYRTVVPASASDIYALLADPHRHHELDGSGMVKAEVIGPHKLSANEKFRTSMQWPFNERFKMPYSRTNQVLEAEENTRIAWTNSGGHIWRWELRELGDDEAKALGMSGTATEVTESFDYRTSPFARFYELTKVTAKNAKGIKASLRRLQQLFADADNR